MARIKRVLKPKKIEFAIESKDHSKFEQLYLQAKMKDTGLTKGEFFSIVLQSYHDGTDAVTKR